MGKVPCGWYRYSFLKPLSFKLCPMASSLVNQFFYRIIQLSTFATHAVVAAENVVCSSELGCGKILWYVWAGPTGHG